VKELQYPEDWTKEQVDKDTRKWERIMTKCYDDKAVNAQMPLGKETDKYFSNENTLIRNLCEEHER